MYRTTSHSFLTALLLAVSLCLSLNGLPTQAEDKATQEHQNLHQMDYTPLHFGRAAGSGQPLIQVTLNDTQAATFLVDTGSTCSIISTELAKQMNLPLRPAVDSTNAPVLWKGKRTLMTNASVLKAGTVLFKDVPLFVLDAKQFVLSPSANDVNLYQGILGINLMQKIAVLLDTRKHKLVFCIPGNLSKEQVGQIGITQTFLSLTHVNDSQWYIQAKFVNGTLKGNEGLIIDTGSDSTYVSEQLAQKIDLKVQRLKGNETIRGIDAVAEATVDELDLGELTVLGFPLTVRPDSENLPPALGMDILSSYRVLMDFPGSKMYLQPNNLPAPTITVAPQTTPPGQTPPQSHP